MRRLRGGAVPRLPHTGTSAIGTSTVESLYLGKSGADNGAVIADATTGFYGRTETLLRPRIGGAAARQYVEAIKTVLLATGIMLLGGAIGITDSAFKSQIVLLIALALLALALILFMVGLSRMRKFRRSVATALGVNKVRWGEPPFDLEKYKRWCKDRGVEPFRQAQASST